jgi:polygalacturonase
MVPVLDVRGHGAVGDGAALDTAALQKAIDACAASGGGTVRIPAGKYLTGSLFLKSGVAFSLDAGAVILGSENPADYPIIESRWEGETRKVHAPLIYGENLVNVALIGRGKIDGRGGVWWRRHREKSLAHPRPRLISFSGCTGVLIRGIIAVNSPSWTINPVRCEDVVIDGVTIMNPADSPNTDGINPDSCSRVRISDCLVSVGDDCITLKSGIEREKPELRSPCEDVTVTNCILEKGHGAVVIGSEMSGGVRRVVISNCVFNGTDRGIRLKSRRGRGGTVEDVRVSNIVMNDVLCPFTMNLYYGCGAWGDPVVSDKGMRPADSGTPRFRGISLSGITARGVRHAAAFLYGLAESPIEDVSLSDVSITLAADADEGYPEMADGLSPMSRDGMFVRYAKGLRLDRVRIEDARGTAFTIRDSESVEIRACGTATPAPGSEVIGLAGVRGAFIQGCRTAAGTDTFISVQGETTAGIVLASNDLSGARTAVRLARDVAPGAVSNDSGSPH